MQTLGTHLSRHDLLLEHAPREVGHLQPHEASDQLLGLVALTLGRLLLALLRRICLDGVLDLAAARPEDDEFHDGIEECLAGGLDIVLLSYVPR